MTGEKSCETYVSTEQAGAQAPPRLPHPDGDRRGPQGAGAAPRQGPQEAVGLTDPPVSATDRIATGKLRRRRSFLFVAQGLKAGRPSCLVQMRDRADGSGAVNIGYTASKKVGGAVERNRAKRRLREAARLLLPERAAPGFDYVFIANARTPGVSWAQLLDDVTAALQRLARLREAPKAQPSAQPPETP